MHRRARLIVPLVAAAALLTWGGVAYGRAVGGPDGAVAASGTIEANQVSAASKIPGRIAQIPLRDGGTVWAGGPRGTTSRARRCMACALRKVCAPRALEGGAGQVVGE